MINLQKRDEKGITLVALVITIIVLIILVGLVITLSLGNNGIFNRAKQAKEEYKIAQAREELEIEISNVQLSVMSQENRQATLDDLLLKIDKNRYTIELEHELIATISEVNSSSVYAKINRKGTNYKFIVNFKLEIIDFVEEDRNIEVDKCKYIYNYGTILEEANNFVGISDIYAENKMNANNIYTNVTGTTGYNFTYVGTENKINLQGYRKICCLVTTGDNAICSGNIFKLAINDTKLPSGLDEPYIKEVSSTVQANQTNYVLEWKIPENYRDESYYIGFISTLKDVYVYKIWLEPVEQYMVYNEGKICEEANNFVGISDIYAENKMNANNIYTNVTGTTGYNFTYVGTENKINLQGYRKICCLVTTGDNAICSGNIFKLAINDTKLPSGLDEPYIKEVSSTVQANQTNYVLEWKIPENYRDENYYIGFISTLKDVYVYKIWLED